MSGVQVVFLRMTPKGACASTAQAHRLLVGMPRFIIRSGDGAAAVPGIQTAQLNRSATRNVAVVQHPVISDQSQRRHFPGSLAAAAVY